FSSNARHTWSNTIIGPPKPRASLSNAARSSATAMSIEKNDEDLGHHEIHGDHRHRTGDDRQLGGVADALRAAGGAQPDVAADRHDREAEEDRLDDAHPDVLHVESLHDAAPVDRARD